MHGYDGATKTIICLAFDYMYSAIFPQLATCNNYSEAKLLFYGHFSLHNIRPKIFKSVPCTRSYQIYYFKSFNFVIVHFLDAEDDSTFSLKLENLENDLQHPVETFIPTH